MQQLNQAVPSTKEVRTAAERGEYAVAVALASSLVPGLDDVLSRYRERMESYEEARQAGDWRRALRSLADARAAAIASGLPELESVVTHRLFDVVRLQQEGRP